MDRGEGKIRISSGISEGEKLSTENRKVGVKKCLDHRGIPCNLDDVPNIAILGAGGGLRAMIALLGTLEELQKQGLLDTIIYLCGVSGSTWCMSSLYKNGNWAEKLQALEQCMRNTIVKSTWSLTEAIKMLVEAANDDNYSLTDFWAYTVVYGMLHELDMGHLSDQRGASENGKNPYPIYAAVDEQRFCKVTEYSPETWFEFTPHEASFLGWGASIPTEYFGSEYKNGELKKKKEEKSMSYLQGLWGSCIGSKKENEQVIKDIFLHFFERKNEPGSPFLVTAESTLEGIVEGFPAPTIEREDDTESNSVTGYNRMGAGSLLDFAKMLAKTSQDIFQWKWGTNNNFLYKCSAIDSTELVKDEAISLVDAGIAINLAFPLVLHQDRNVKMILSFDYGPFDPFKAIRQAAKYCKDNNIPFPDIDEESLTDPDNPDDCYIFRGDGAPTVMHFPLFNKVNCPGYVKEWSLQFTPLRFAYNEGGFNELLQAARLNVSNNKDKILQEIRNIIGSSSKKSSS